MTVTEDPLQDEYDELAESDPAALARRCRSAEGLVRQAFTIVQNYGRVERITVGSITPEVMALGVAMRKHVEAMDRWADAKRRAIEKGGD